VDGFFCGYLVDRKTPEYFYVEGTHIGNGMAERLIISGITGAVVFVIVAAITRDGDRAGKPTAVGLLVGFFAANQVIVLLPVVIKFILEIVIAGVVIAGVSIVAWRVFKEMKIRLQTPVAQKPEKSKQDRIKAIQKNSKIPEEMKKKQIQWMQEGE
jgi:threonine/homoserine/homoserine lactone efflux protein